MKRIIKFRVFYKRKTRDGTMSYNPDLRTNTYKKAGMLMSNYPDTTVVMQYTGLVDGMGCEIYEGDIVKKMTSKKLFEVVWNDWYTPEFVFKLIHPIGLNKWFHPTYKSAKSQWEVIGNIYENKELLSEKNS